jgi:hypothetical protein
MQSQNEKSMQPVDDLQGITKLFKASSPYFFKLADALTKSVDRQTLAELIAGDLYFRSTGRNEGDFAQYLLTKKLDIVTRIIGNCIPVVFSGLLRDREFRSLIIRMTLQTLS